MLDEFGISLTGEVYSDSCHSQTVFDRYPDKVFRQKNEFFEGTDYLCRHHICPPLHLGLRREEIKYVADSLRWLFAS